MRVTQAIIRIVSPHVCDVLTRTEMEHLRGDIHRFMTGSGVEMLTDADRQEIAAYDRRLLEAMTASRPQELTRVVEK